MEITIGEYTGKSGRNNKRENQTGKANGITKGKIKLGLFAGGVEVCMFVFYRKGLKSLKDGNFHKARLWGIWNCVMALYVYPLMVSITEVVLELQDLGVKFARCSYLLFLVYQLYVILLFLKLRHSEKTKIIKKQLG